MTGAVVSDSTLEKIRLLLDELVGQGAGGVTDHGALTGLADNDHPQYLLSNWTNFPATVPDYGIYPLQIARIPFDPSADASLRAQGDHTVSSPIFPTNTIVVATWWDTVTAFHSAANTARVAVTIQSAGDVLPANLVTTAPLTAIRNNGNLPITFNNAIKLTAPRSLVFNVSVQDLTVGRTMLNLLFVPGAA